MAARQSSTSRRSRSKPKRAAAVPPTSGDQLQTNGRSAEGRSHRPTTPPHTRGVVSESPSLAVGTAAGTSTFAEATLTRRPSLAPRVYGARYRCNYCSRDVSNCTRITCAACSDFDLCISCFSVGACLYPHELSHPYRVVEHVSRPVFSSDWSAEEEMRLLEGLEIYGPGNFHTVAEYVGTKSKIKCEQHYLEVYLDAEDTAPLPNPKRMVTDMRVVLPAIPVGTPRSAVVAREMALTAAAAANLNPALARLAQIRLKANESRGTEMEITDASKPSWDERSTRLAADDGLVTASALSPTARRDDWLSEQKGPATDKSSDNTSVDLLSSGSPTMVPSEINLSAVLADEEAQSIRVSPSGRPRKGDIVGYMSKRQDYDVEPYQNDAESIIADMYITDEDTAEERELKQRILEIYSLWLDERTRRKLVVEQRGFTDLAGARAREKSKTPLERRLGRQLLPFARLMADHGSHHDELVTRMTTEVQLIEEIREIWEALCSGVGSLAEYERWRRERSLREHVTSIPVAVDWVEAPGRGEEAPETGSSATNNTTSGTIIPRRPRGRPKRIRTEDVPSIAVGLSVPGLGRPSSSGKESGRSSSAATTAATQALSVRVLRGESAAEVQHWPSIVQRRQVAQPLGIQQLPSASNSTNVQNLLFVENWPSAKFLSPLEKELCALLRLVPDRFLEIRSLIATRWKARIENGTEHANQGRADQEPKPCLLTLDLRAAAEAAANAQPLPGDISRTLGLTPSESLVAPVAAEFVSSNDEDRSSSPRGDEAFRDHSESSDRAVLPGRPRGRYRRLRRRRQARRG